MYDSAVPSIFTMLCSHHPHLAPELSHHPKWRPRIHWQLLLPKSQSESFHEIRPGLLITEAPKPAWPLGRVNSHTLTSGRRGLWADAHLQRFVEVINDPQVVHLLLHFEQLWVHCNRKIEKFLSISQLLAVLFMSRELLFKNG